MRTSDDLNTRPARFYPVRCAIYTRVNATSGPRVQRRSLAAQRALCAAYLAAQGPLNWQATGERYEDRGCRGATLDRAAFQRLMTDVEAGRIDMVVATRLDRLCTSLFDAVQVLYRFERSGVTFLEADAIPIRSVTASAFIVMPTAAMPGEVT